MSTTTNSPKKARLDLRLPEDARSLIVDAVELAGPSLTDYVLSIVVPTARRDVLEAQTVRLGKRAW